ncbi:hypothetical protein B7494_g8409 [Chlorociboria aeruginascens]|nr:hypothetical protein B7494_g8409 [Chlorociboria aeruginascens]
MGFLSRLRNDTYPAIEDPEAGDATETIEKRDEAAVIEESKIPPTIVSYHVTPEMEKRYLRKLDKVLVPLVSGLYLLSYLDRSNVGNAKIAGMQTDLKLTTSSYTWLLTIFYISYIIFEFFALMWKVIPPHIWAAFCVVSWGIAATLQAAAYSWSGMMAARFFLGVFEAGFGPGIPYLLSFFYLRQELGFRIGLFLSAAPLATCFAGALAYGITSGDPPTIANWKLLFLVEGLPSVCMGVAVWFLLPDSPGKARFLDEEDLKIAKRRGLRQSGSEKIHRIGRIHWPDVAVGLLDVKNYFTALMYFSCNVSFSSLPVFLPTILSEMGFTNVDAQGLSAPPYFLAFLLTFSTCYLADRTQQRGLIITILSLVGATGYIMLATTSSVGPRYAGVFLAAAGVFPAIGNILPWVLNNQGSDTKRGMGIVMLNTIGQCGPLLGTRLYPGGEQPYYRKAWENRKLDKKFGSVARMDARGGLDGGVQAEIGEGDEDDGPRFRYVL